MRRLAQTRATVPSARAKGTAAREGQGATSTLARAPRQAPDIIVTYIKAIYKA